MLTGSQKVRENACISRSAEVGSRFQTKSIRFDFTKNQANRKSIPQQGANILIHMTSTGRFCCDKHHRCRYWPIYDKRRGCPKLCNGDIPSGEKIMGAKKDAPRLGNTEKTRREDGRIYEIHHTCISDR